MSKLTVFQKFEDQITKHEQDNLKELLEQSPFSPAKFKQIVITEFKRSKSMQDAFISNPTSLFASILHCAEMGLNPSSLVGEFYFLAKDGGIVPMIGYKGLITLLMRSEKISKIWSEVVYKGDDFEFELGLNPNMVHVPNYKAPRKAENIDFVYSCVKFKDGETQFKVLSRDEVKDLADIQKGTNDLFFNDKKDPENWMVKKSSLKQLCKTLPKEHEIIKKAIALDDNVEGGGYVILDDNQELSVIKGKIVGKSNIYGNLSKSILDQD